MPPPNVKYSFPFLLFFFFFFLPHITTKKTSTGVIMLKVIMLKVMMLKVMMLKVVMLKVVLLRVIMLKIGAEVPADLGHITKKKKALA